MTKKPSAPFGILVKICQFRTVIDSSNVQALKELLSKPKKIVITSHKNPDGDALGSSLGWKRFLTLNGHSVDYVSPNAMPDFFQWLPGASSVVVYEKNKDYGRSLVQSADLIFCLDYNALSRIDDLGEQVRLSPAKKIMIDHHLQPEDFADIAFSNIQASSTGEMVFDVIEALNGIDKIDKNCAELLYTAILTDTGSFAFSCTTQRVHHVVSILMGKGVDPNHIHNLVYNCFTENRLRFFGYCITEKMHVIPGTDVAYISVTQSEMRSFDIREGETEGLVNYPLKIEKINAVGLFREKDKQIRISFRSKGNFDVNTLSREHFGGGGHMNAAGGVSYDSLDATIAKFVSLFQNKQS